MCTNCVFGFTNRTKVLIYQPILQAKCLWWSVPQILFQLIFLNLYRHVKLLFCLTRFRESSWSISQLALDYVDHKQTFSLFVCFAFKRCAVDGFLFVQIKTDVDRQSLRRLYQFFQISFSLQTPIQILIGFFPSCCFTWPAMQYLSSIQSMYWQQVEWRNATFTASVRFITRKIN